MTPVVYYTGVAAGAVTPGPLGINQIQGFFQQKLLRLKYHV